VVSLMGTSRLPMARFEPPAVRTIARERVDRLLDRAWDVPLTVIVGPAGAGKTTAASHLAHRSAAPSLWYRAHAVDGDEATLCEHLAQAWAHATGTRCRWDGIADVLVGMEQAGPPVGAGHADRAEGLLLVIDEFDSIIGTPGEAAVAAAVADLSPSMHLLTLSRHRPSLNLTRLRLANAVCEVGPDDLRFRSWEVDRLFRELYDRPLLPEEVVELERRTGGWAAALHLFNMAVTGLAPVERRNVLAQVGRRAGPDWDFLADNVLAGLRDELKLFLLETAPLPRLTSALCDDLLGTSDSWHRLDELERLQLVTPSPESPGSFRSHEVLRSHLTGVLVEWEGADAVRKRYRRAAESLEANGHVTEALDAYCRGEDWTSAGRLLGSRGAEVADRAGGWLGGLPRTFLDTEPWLLLAAARLQRSDGRLAEAIATYQRVERASLTSVPVTIARRERLLLASLLDRSSPPSLAWVGALRDAAFGDLSAVVLEGRTAHDDLAMGVVRLVTGDVTAARGLLRRARDARDASPVLSLAAGLAHLVAGFLSGTATAVDADALERAATPLEIPFLARLCRAAAGMVTDEFALVDDAVAACDRAGDAVGGALCATLGALGAAWGGSPAAIDGNAAARCRHAGLRNVEVWAQVAASITAARAGKRPAAVDEADPLGKRRTTRALHRLIVLAGALAEPDLHDAAVRHAARLDVDHGIVLPARVHDATPAPAPAATATAAADVLELRCFGSFTATRGGRPVGLGGLRPRARAVLRLLAVGETGGVHRNVLCDELWPDDDEDSATRKLHVAISSVRRAVDDAGAAIVRRQGEMYLLDADVRCDVRQFRDELAAARHAADGPRSPAATASLRRALALHRGALLPEDVASDWIERNRRELQAMAADAARRLAGALLADGDAVGAIEVCRAGLAVDRYADPVWRLLIEALHADGDLAGRALAEAQYDAVLAEIGVDRAPAPGR
jgi:DNA-binding SARP family transcriptional activator